jgi:hypothetical protein
VNACHDDDRHKIMFPAAIREPSFRASKADEAVNDDPWAPSSFMKETASMMNARSHENDVVNQFWNEEEVQPSKDRAHLVK